MRLDGKTILVTAAGQGIGRASALACAAEGARVIATDINADTLAALKAENGAIDTRRLDVTQTADIEALAAELPALDGLFNCVGYVHNGTILDLDDEAWAMSVDINVTSMVRMCRSFIPGMLERAAATGAASIVNMSSMASTVKGVPQPRGLWHDQGGRDRADQGNRRRLCERGASLQRGLPRHGRHAIAQGANRCRTRSCAGGKGLHCPPADGAAGHDRRHCADGRLSDVGRRPLRHRPGAVG